MSNQSSAENARFLMALAPSDGSVLTLYDEADRTVHELDNGVLVITTGFVDGTTYTLTLVAVKILEKLNSGELSSGQIG